MEADGLIEKVVVEKKVFFNFPDPGELPLPILHIDDVSFSYSGKEDDMLYRNLDLSVDLDSRIALVGPNGAGTYPCVYFVANSNILNRKEYTLEIDVR